MIIDGKRFCDLVQSLASRGFSLSDLIRQPVRLYGMWICEVRQ